MARNQHPSSTAHRPETLCHCCGDRPIEIEMLIDDRTIAMRSCPTCGTRLWHLQGVATELTEILTDLTSLDNRYRRDGAKAS